ncbi:hypothetical protein GW932_03685, partial [archaeon]|nr:hypothetical protein [archaeon]
MKFLFGLFTFVLFLGVVSSAIWVNDPNNCPQEYQAQNCIPNKVCGFHGETTECASLSDMLLGAPSSTNSNTLYQSSLSGGFIFDCVYYGGTYPYCINSAACNRASECSTLNRWTECNDWGSYTCTTCVTGYQYCDGSYTDANGCEIQTGVTSRGTNVVYGTSCSYQCVSGYLDCDGDSTGSDGDCEIQVGVTSFTEANTVYLTCTTASCSSGFMACEGETATVDGCNYQIGASCTTGEGKPGTWQSGCVCQELAQEHFITNTEAKGWGDFLLFGKQYNPIGWLMNLTNSEGKSIAIDNESCIIFNDGSKMCGAGNITIGGGEIVNESNYSTYTTWWSNVSGFVSDWLIQTGDNLDFNQTKLDENYLRNDGDNASGRYNFDGAWSEGGVTIDSGEIFAQRLYVYNVTSLAINHLNINGSLIPENFDNTFDIGSSLLRWRDGYFGNDVYIDGQSVNDRLTSINFSGGNNEILMTNGFGSTKTNSNFKYDGTTNTLEITDGTNPSRISPGSLSFNSDNVIVSGSSGFTPQLGNFVQGSFYTWYNTANFITIGSTSSDIVDRSLLDIYLVDNNQANHLYFGTDGVFLSGYNSDNWDNDYLITKGYADATYGAGTSYTFSNGLTESGGSVSLGGALTGDTYIYGDRFTTDLFFGQTGGNEMNSINMYSSGNITLSSLGGSVLLSNAIYAADYSLGFVNRSLVDKEYVDTAVSSVGNFYTFSNGLTESGGSVSLGGNLTQDLFFTTTPSYSFNIQNNENNQ